MATLPIALCSSVPITFARPDGSVQQRLILPQAHGIVVSTPIGTYPIAFFGTVGSPFPLLVGSTSDAHTAIPSLVTTVTLNGLPAMTAGTVLTCDDGYVGTIGVEHCAVSITYEY